MLAPIDLSAHSSALAETARRVAPKAHLTLAHAFEVPFEGKLQFAGVSEDDILHYSQEERQTALVTLRTWAEMQDRPNIRLEHGRPEAVIPILLRETVTDLVVGKHEKSETIDLLLGSMT